MALVLITPPTSDPVSLAEAKAHCRIENSDEDGLIAGYLLAARRWVETAIERRLVTQTWDYLTDYFAGCIEPPIGPLQSVTSIQYVDSAGSLQMLPTTEYQVDTASLIARIVPAYGKSWPAARCEPNAVRVRVVVGYGSNPGDIPNPIRHAILMLVGHYYEQREAANVSGNIANVPLGVGALLSAHRVIYT